MTKRFVVSTGTLNADQEKRLKDEFSGRAWWHWMPNFWLVKDQTDTMTASQIVAAIHKIGGRTAKCLVLEVEHKNWATLERPDPKGRRMSDWLKSTWTKP